MDTRRYSLGKSETRRLDAELNAEQEGNLSKAEMYVEHLREEGFNPHVDDDGDVIFRYEGRTYVLTKDDRDPTFFRLLLPNFWEIESAEEHFRALTAVNKVNARMKVVKIVVVNQDTWASVELFIDPIERFADVFHRCLQLIAEATREFRSAMQPDAD